MDKLKIVGYQSDMVWKNKKENLQRIDHKFAEVKADIFLLPEMFPTGYCMDVAEISDKNQETLKWMCDFSKRHQAAIGGSVAIAEGSHYYNRFYFIEKAGKIHQYDKRHLFTYASEDQYYTAGKDKVVFEYSGWKICLQVCYDLRFPVFQRNIENYDLILNVASWPSTRMLAWKTLLAARAIENQAYVFGLNRIGKSGTGLLYTGESQCYFPDGNPVGTLKENLLSAELDRGLLNNFKKQFPFLADRDSFQLQ